MSSFSIGYLVCFFGAPTFTSLTIGIEEKANVVLSIGSLVTLHSIQFVCLGGLDHFPFDFYISH